MQVHWDDDSEREDAQVNQIRLYIDHVMSTTTLLFCDSLIENLYMDSSIKFTLFVTTDRF